MISIEEFVERLCLLGASAPRRFPRKLRDREILMKSMLIELRSSAVYREAEINEHLLSWLRDIAPAIETDHVTLRRLLVDFGYLERTADGGRYRLGFPARPVAYAMEIDDLDQRATIARYRSAEKRQRERVRRTKLGR